MEAEIAEKILAKSVQRNHSGRAGWIRGGIAKPLRPERAWGAL
jgi:hypothetical protein